MAEASATSLPAAAPADSISSRPSLSRLSFASVAAMSPSSRSNTPAAASKLAENRPPLPVGSSDGKPNEAKSLRKGTPLDVLQESVAKLNLDAKPAPGPVIASADTEPEQPQPLTNVLRNDDEKTHLSFVSNPTMSTDMRSIVSGTAFMDEKESIRPDESASVKGADESDSVSGPGSGGLQSQVASEAGQAGFRDQFQEVSTAKKALPLTVNLVGRVPEDVGRNPIQSTVEFQPQGPDEKLLDALENPKDRIFLLQLEQQVIAFIANTKEQVLSLPPQNSFCRLLAHRLGDYYSLSHTADATLGSVRLGKTEATRLPPSLKDIASPGTPESGVAPQQPALKIMRRNKAGGYGKDIAGDDAADGSTVQSQIGSDTGASGTDLQRSPSKSTKNMTREEREAHYQATRDRIFGDLEEVKPSTETSTAASRASSSTGGKPKKVKNRPKNDDFEPRSSFMNMGYQQQQTNFGFNERPQQQMYGFPSPIGPGMPPQSMAGGYNDGPMAQQPNFQQQPMQPPYPQMQPQQMSMNGAMPGYAQTNYSQPAMYNSGYGFSGQPQPMAPIPMQQQQYYPGPDQMVPYNNMMGSPMMHPNQQGYGPGYQGWNAGMPVQYGSQDQQGYFPQLAQSGPPGGMMFHNPQKAIEGTTPPARFNPGEYPLNMSPQQAQHAQQQQQMQQQQGQWQQWQGPPQYGQYPNMPGPWQNGQPAMQNSSMPPNAMMQNQKNMYQPQNMGQGQGKHYKKGTKGGKGAHSELGKYDTSSLPPKPPAPVQGE